MTDALPKHADIKSANLMRAIRTSVIFVLLFGLILSQISSYCKDQIDHALYVRQDFWLMIAIFFLFLLIIPATKIYCNKHFRFSSINIVILILLVASFCFAGHYLILAGVDLSWDERLANFDGWVYARGKLAWPLPIAWQRDSGALNLLFMMPVRQPIAWISSYLPMNAAIRALVGIVATPALTGPLLTGLSLPLLWGCARNLWPDDREAAIVAVALLATSGQFLFTGMTAFAMPAHLFFNLLWLWLFLKDRRSTDLLALTAGFVATGLHQPLFHPLFVAPWLILLLHQRRFKRLAVFVAGYALICSFWLWWPHYIEALVTGPASLADEGSIGYWSRLITALSSNKNTLGLMGTNLLRFLTWQNILLIPLIVFGINSARSSGTGIALLVGFVLPIIVMAIVLPAQGYGFGYRYLQPVLGNAALLGAIGWRRLDLLRDRMRAPFVLATALSVLVMLPIQGWMSHQLFSIVAEKEEQLRSSEVDYVLLPTVEPSLVADFAYNLPDLSNRPLILRSVPARDIDRLAARICPPGARVALASAGMFDRLKRYFQTIDEDDRAWLSAMTNAFSSAGCTVKILR